jgi:hypothetical protein
MPTSQNALMPDSGGSLVPQAVNDLGQWFYNATGGARAAQTRGALAHQAQTRMGALNDWGNAQAAAMQQPVYDRATHQLTDNGQQVANLVSGFVGGDGFASGAVPSEVGMLHNLPSMPQRAFSADYPGGVAADQLGRLTTDMHGQPLTAPYVAGRKMVGEPDVPIPPDAFATIAQGVTGQAPQAVPMSRMGGDAFGQYASGPGGGQVSYYEGLSPTVAQQVIGHETGHALDEIAGQIPTDGLHGELSQVYQTGTGAASPAERGYNAEAAPREMMAEAVRAYMTDPNYLKSVAPQTANVIRSTVNTHPTLSRYVQFNSLAPIAGVGLAGAGAMMQPAPNALMPSR